MPFAHTMILIDKKESHFQEGFEIFREQSHPVWKMIKSHATLYARGCKAK